MIIVDESIKNKDHFSYVNNELKELKADMDNKYNTLIHKQMMQIDNLKFVLEHSGSSRLKNLTKRILSNDLYDINKIEYKFVKPSESELDNAAREMNQKKIEKRQTLLKRNLSITPNSSKKVSIVKQLESNDQEINEEEKVKSESSSVNRIDISQDLVNSKENFNKSATISRKSNIEDQI